MKLGKVKIRNFKDGIQSGCYTSFSDNRLIAEAKIIFKPISHGNPLLDEADARTYPE